MTETGKPGDQRKRPSRPWHNRVPPQAPPRSPMPSPEGTTYGQALLATAAWSAVCVAFLAGALAGSPPSEEEASNLVANLIVVLGGSTFLGALFTWRITRKRRRPFWHVLLIALPMFAIAYFLADAFYFASQRSP
ncbi:hypothetical protein RM780_25360 [Streptomyces sp. DSM 44917]|uniref:Uncharacterized protein n=1 Tax=Streptomyces boetiae TaxID=3075541 RepID=A0ABU2LF89_9ACTN|nr:hypothetical protein [Streptomyces sp. DSM 44917]MDT0310255.1 hypothetical protein [Streptomyces sp. DSM 44917]